LEPGSFSLSEPIPTSIVLRLGGKDYIVPAGATANQVIGDPGTDDLGRPRPQGEHSNFWTIERGATRVLVDGDTGEVFEFDIAEEDTDDFEDFLE
jgi:hypothetical protein